MSLDTGQPAWPRNTTVSAEMGERNCRTVVPSSWGVKLTVGRLAPLTAAKGSMAENDVKTGSVPAPSVLKNGLASAPHIEFILGGDG